MEVIPGNDAITEEAGLYHLNLINMNLPSSTKSYIESADGEESHITQFRGRVLRVFTGPKDQIYQIYDYITNFWFSETKKPLPDSRPYTMSEIKELFPEIVKGDHRSGEFGLYKISGHVVLFVKSEDGELDDNSKQVRYGNLALKEGKKNLLDMMKPLLNPLIVRTFNKYIRGDIDLEEFKETSKSQLPPVYEVPEDYDPSQDWSKITSSDEEEE